MEYIKLFSKIHKISFYLLVFLIPLWFLPITQEVVNYQKQALLIVLTLVIIISWFAKTVIQGELNIRVSWFYIPVLALIISSAISTVISIWRYGSFWGWPLNTSDSFVTILFFGLLYFLIAITVKDIQEVFQIFYIFFVSVIFAGVYALLQLYQFFIISFPFAKVITFNTIGSVNSIAVISAVILPFALIIASSLKTTLKWWVWFFVILLLAIMLLINFSNAWIILVAELIILLVFGIWNIRKKMQSGWVSFSMALLVISLFFLIFRVSFPWSPALPLEVYPSRSAEIIMIKNVLKENPLFGTGPGTFVYDYARYHQTNLNQTIFWGTRFISGASEILDWFLTKGIIGGLALIALIVTVIVLTLRNLIKSESDSLSWIMTLGLLSSFVGISASYIIYYSNFTLSFLFWMLLGGLSVIVFKFEKKISVSPPAFFAVAWSFIFLLVLIFSIGFLFIEGQRYIAEIQYLKGMKLVALGNNQKGIEKILLAVKFNSSMDLYWRDLAQLYLSQANKVTDDKNLSNDQKKQQAISNITNAIAAVNQAVAVNPENVENWNVRGFIYRNIIGVQDANVLAVESYNKAMQLEPASPFSVTELGRVYLAKAQVLASQKGSSEEQKEALLKALENLEKAIKLKADYAPANYLIALIYDLQGKSDDAIKKLENTKTIAPNDIGLAFQLGVLYYRKNDMNSARIEFERAKNLNSDYANARYMLGLVYDRQGQTSKAIGEFTKVSQLNPDNEQVKKIISNLNSGKPALDSIQLGQPPIQENPSEIKNKTESER